MARTNLAVFSSALHLGSDPALLGIVTRPTTVPRHTYANLKASGCYTLNHVPVALAAPGALHLGQLPDTFRSLMPAASRPSTATAFPRPTWPKAPLSIGLRLLEEHHISNGTVLLVGTVEHVYCAKKACGPMAHWTWPPWARPPFRASMATMRCCRPCASATPGRGQPPVPD